MPEALKKRSGLVIGRGLTNHRCYPFTLRFCGYLLTMDTFLMAAMLAVGLLPYLPVCNRIKPRATASDCSVAVFPFARGFGQSDNVVVSIFVGMDGNADNPEEDRD